MRPLYHQCHQELLRHERNVIKISTKSILLEVPHAAISSFAPFLGSSKHCRHNTNIHAKITVPRINVYNIRKTLAKNTSTKEGVSPLKHMGSLTRFVRSNTSHTSDNPLWRDKLQFVSPKNRQKLLPAKNTSHSLDKKPQMFVSNFG